jgi:hypothetical protein
MISKDLEPSSCATTTTEFPGPRGAMSNQTIRVERIKQLRKYVKNKTPRNQCGSLPSES